MQMTELLKALEEREPGAGEMIQQLGACTTALAEDLNLIPSSHVE